MSYEPIRTKPVRAAAPPLRRFSNDIFLALAQRTKFVDPALVAAWGKVAGPGLAALCRPGRLTGGRTGRTLEVVVPNGAAAAKVQFEAEGLRRRLNEFLGPGTVGRIAVRQTGAPLAAAEEDTPGSLGTALSRFRASFTKKRDGDR